MLGVFFTYLIALGILSFFLYFEPDADYHLMFPIFFCLTIFISSFLVRQLVSQYHYKLESGGIAAPWVHHGGIEEWMYRLMMNREIDFRSVLPPEWFETAKFRWKDFFYQLWPLPALASLVVGFFAASAVRYYHIPVHPLLAFAMPVWVTILFIFLFKKTFFEGYDIEMMVLNAMRDELFLEWCESNGYLLNPVNVREVLLLHRRYVDYVNGESDAFVKWLEESGKSDADEEEMSVLYEEFQNSRKE